MKMQTQKKFEQYEKIIGSMDMLTLKMEAIAKEYFEANVDFINQMADVTNQNKGVINDTLASYYTRFNGLLEDLEQETKLLKREKVNFQFRRNLLADQNNARLA